MNLQKHHHVLVAVSGMTPQIITETLYGIHQLGLAFPDEIQVISTAEGARRIHATLLEQGILESFCKDYQRPMPIFGKDQIHVLHDAAGNAMSDIRKPVENEYMADMIVNRIQKLTADGDQSLHVSLAGGRKTMGYYVGYALSLFGRPQDVLSHVLVADDYESSPDFWYPTPYPKSIRSRSGKDVDARLAEVHLAQIPFVRLREWLPQPVLLNAQSFSEVVANTQMAYRANFLVVDVPACRISLNGHAPVILGEVDFAFYWLMARRLQQNKSGIPVLVDGEYDYELGDEFLSCYRRIKKMEPDESDRTVQGLKVRDSVTGQDRYGLTKSFIEQRKVKINQAFSTQYGLLCVERFGINRPSAESGDLRRYMLALSPHELQLKE